MASFNSKKGIDNGVGSNINTNNIQQNKGFFSKILRDLSSFGMNPDDLLFKNSYARGMNERPSDVNMTGMGGNYDHYIAFSEAAMAHFLDNKSISAFDRAYPEKREILREYSKKSEINEFVRTIVNEAVVYDQKKYFCRPEPLTGDYSDNIKERFYTVFNKIYSKFEFNDGKKAMNVFRQFVVDGYLAFEIIFDEKFKNIIGFKMLDSSSLYPALDPLTLKRIWIQDPDNIMSRRVLLDTQVIYLSYSDIHSAEQTSYVENLIRPYNLYKIIEETIVMYRVTNATMFKKFVIPTDGMTPAQSREAICKLKASYEDKVEFDSKTGAISINGSTNIPYSKEIWMPSSNGNSPSIELVNNEGPNLLETDTITFFFNSLKRSSVIPLTRLDQNNPGGGNIFQEAGEVTRDELFFSRFINTLRMSWVEIITKPIWIQMCLDFPELKENEKFKSDVSVIFNKDNMYEEWQEINNMKKRVEIITAMLELKIKNGDQEESLLDPEYLAKKYLKFSDMDWQDNEKSKQKRNKLSAGGEEETSGEAAL